MVILDCRKIIIVYTIFLSLGSAINFILFQNDNFIVIIGSTLFMLIASLLFQFQKITLIKQLSAKLYGKLKGINIVFDDGVIYDFIEKFLIISEVGISYCSSYLNPSNIFSKIFNKKNVLLKYKFEQIEYIQIENNKLKVVLIDSNTLIYKNIKLNRNAIKRLIEMKYRIKLDNQMLTMH